MMYGDMITVHCKNYAELVNTLCGRSEVCLYYCANPSSTCSNQVTRLTVNILHYLELLIFNSWQSCDYIGSYFCHPSDVGECTKCASSYHSNII